jgi:AraC family transcriptional regulator
MNPNTSNVIQTGLPNPRFEHAGSMRIAGLRKHFTSSSLDDIPELWKRLVSLGKVPGRTSPVDYAVVIPSSDGCDYLAGFEVADPTALPKDFAYIDIPANEYAVFLHNGHVSTLRDTFDVGVNRWLPASHFQMGRTTQGERYAIERYGEKFNPATGMDDIELWIPVHRG